MLAAGWGGAGSVVKDSHRNFFESRIIEHALPTTLDWSDSATPKVASVASESQVKYCVRDDYDAPHFSRSLRWDDTDESPPLSEASAYTGLTPLALSEWLRVQPMIAWPTTYSGLEAIGLGSGVIDWLELAIAAQDSGTVPEADVIQAFLYVMSQRATHELLATSGSLLEHFKVLTQRLKDLMSGSVKPAVRPRVEAKLVENVVAELGGMTAAAWPNSILKAEEKMDYCKSAWSDSGRCAG